VGVRPPPDLLTALLRTLIDMCGIAGFLGTPGSGTPDAAVKAMTDAIAHRGPDADGNAEVLLAAVHGWNIEPSVPGFAGVFALAICDQQERALVHLGGLDEKALFDGHVAGAWLFGSAHKPVLSNMAKIT
jgi:asparagine synthetase B (glutamine-hydrolysing)